MTCEICETASGSASSPSVEWFVWVDESGAHARARRSRHAFARGGRYAANVADGVAMNPDVRPAQRLPGSLRHLRTDNHPRGFSRRILRVGSGKYRNERRRHHDGYADELCGLCRDRSHGTV
jgi:hypothetical protein